MFGLRPSRRDRPFPLVLRLRNMPVGKSIRQIRIFLASSDDVKADRELASRAAEEVNAMLSPHIGFEIQMRRWEEVAPGIAMGGPQEIIDERIEFGDCEVVIVVLKQRCGSGTLLELRHAIENFKSQGRPEVMLYFCTGFQPKNSAETRDLLS